MLSDQVIDHMWKMYQQGQASADHTAKEVFASTLQSLADWLPSQQPAAAAQPALYGEALEKCNNDPLRAAMYLIGKAMSEAKPAAAPKLSPDAPDLREQWARVDAEIGAKAMHVAAFDDGVNCAAPVQPVEVVFLAELLARIHRDGGHHQASVGSEQAFRDADAIVVKWLSSDVQPADENSEPSAREQKLAGRVNWNTKQWYEHVGAWEDKNDQIVFGSVMALSAMLVQFQDVTLYSAGKRAAQSPADAAPEAWRVQYLCNAILQNCVVAATKVDAQIVLDSYAIQATPADSAPVEAVPVAGRCVTLSGECQCEDGQQAGCVSWRTRTATAHATPAKAVKIEHLRCYLVRVNVRPSYLGKPARKEALAINGRVAILRASWLCGGDDQYSCEWAMALDDGLIAEGQKWIASGDLEIICGVPEMATGIVAEQVKA